MHGRGFGDSLRGGVRSDPREHPQRLRLRGFDEPQSPQSRIRRSRGNDILAKVTVPQWKTFIDKVRVYADVARRAQDTDDMDEATKQWRRVFGERFKSTVKAATAATYGGFATAVAPSPGYTFPNNPAAPSGKPRGFA